ncbi:MAG: periplasmic protein TonB [Campylobacterota bacterium]|nr:periplasmic protein TonB [Campylobacterota bacterium]
MLKAMNYETRGIVLSLLAHAVVLGAFFSYHEEKQPVQSEKKIAIDLMQYQIVKQEPPKPESVIKKEPPKPQPIEKPIEKTIEKTIEKPKPNPVPKEAKTHKPVIHEKPKPKPKPAEKPKQEPVKKPEETKPQKEPKPAKKAKPQKEKAKQTANPQKMQSKEVKKTAKIQQPLDARVQQQAFLKTNFAVIRDMVLSNLEYPSIAKRMRWNGTAEVKLIIDTSGKLLHCSIFKSSGKKQLDKAALEAAESIASKTLPKPNLKTTVILPIIFELR